MTLPPDVNLASLSVEFVEGAIKNEQSHIDWLSAQIEALQAELNRHMDEQAHYKTELARRKFAVGQRVRYAHTGDIGVVVSYNTQSWIEVRHDGHTYTMWWNPEYTEAI